MNRRGIALITVLLFSSVLVAFIMGGLTMASQHLFQVSGTHRRNQALCAAEAGIFAARHRLESDINYSGVVTGDLEDGSSYRVEVTRNGLVATLRSLGSKGSSRRKLLVRLSLESDSFNAGSAQGAITADSNSYVNGVRSLFDPRQERGNLHTQDTIEVSGSSSKLSVTGKASAINGITGTVDAHETSNQGNPSVPGVQKSNLLAVSFSETSVPSDGRVLSNTEVSGDLNMAGQLYIPEGVTLHVTGDCILQQGVHGGGTLVVEGNTVMRGNTGIFDGSQQGILLFSEGEVIAASNQATYNGNQWLAPIDPLGELFAQMPEDIPYILAQRLPVGAPLGSDFFQWYQQQSQSPTASFLLWKNGDGTAENPGLSSEAISWLDDAGPLASQIQQRASVNP